MNIRRAALLAVPALALTLAACSSQSGTSAPSSSAPASAAASTSASAEASTDANDPETMAMPLAQQAMGVAADQSRTKRNVPADDPDPQLFNYLKEDPAAWTEASKYLADSARDANLNATVDGKDAATVTESDLKLSDGITFVFKGADKTCTVKATFVDAGELTGMAWEGPTCEGPGASQSAAPAPSAS